MGLKLIEAPEDEPVTLARAKQHLKREDTNADDDLIQGLIQAARQHLEGILRRALEPQTWELTLERFPAVIDLPLPPAISVEEITYTDRDGAEQTLAASRYVVDQGQTPARITPAHDESWPSVQEGPDAVCVRYRAGYERDESDGSGSEATGVPGPLQVSILLLLGHWYENRQAVNVGNITSELPMAVAALVAPYRVWMP